VIDELLYKEEVFSIVGAAMEVHSTLGPGFLESVYEAAMMEESKGRGIPFQSQVHIQITYKDIPLPVNFRADYIAYGKIIVEYKVVKKLGPIEEAQLINYLKATGFRVGVLINFNSHGHLEWKRYVV